MADRDADKPRSLTLADTIVGGAVSWLFIVVGSAAVAASALIPAYYDTLDVQEARAVEAVKAEMLAVERQRYTDFHQALVEEDRVLIARLAFTELHLKERGTELAEQASFDPLVMVSEPTPEALERALAEPPLVRPTESELSRPELKRQAKIDVEIERPKQTRLILAATGEYRPYVAGFGALLLLVGLWPRRAAG